MSKKSFTLPREYVADTDPQSLMQDVAGQTGCQEAAESILRSLERLGADDSIQHYEMRPTVIRRAYRGASPVIWSVRAVRD